MIQMICGVFGLPVTNGDRKTVKAMNKDSGPFEAGEEQEKRLVALGIAEYVYDATPIGFDETPPVDPNVDSDEETGEDDFDDDAEIDEAEVMEEIVDLEALTANELRKIGEEYGLTFKSNAKKSEMVAAITAAQAEVAEDEESEPVPTFDASEAVQ